MLGWRGPRTPHVGRRSSERTEARGHEGHEDARRVVGGWLGDGLARDRRPRTGSPALEGRVLASPTLRASWWPSWLRAATGSDGPSRSLQKSHTQLETDGPELDPTIVRRARHRVVWNRIAGCRRLPARDRVGSRPDGSLAPAGPRGPS